MNQGFRTLLYVCIHTRHMNKKILALLVQLLPFLALQAQDAQLLAQKVKAKLATVKDYKANGVMKTDVRFMKIPVSNVIIYYKNPDRFRIKKQDGIAVTPKGGLSVNMNALFAGENYTAVAAGKGVVNGVPVTIIKLLPLDEKNLVVVSTLYIDEKESLIRKAVSTTKENGTYEIEMEYGRYAKWGLPDKVIFTFSTKDYKLPKGLAFDYDGGTKPPPAKPGGENEKGRVEILYKDYTINAGISDAEFK